jgi:hypothetical protein
MAKSWMGWSVCHSHCPSLQVVKLLQLMTLMKDAYRLCICSSVGFRISTTTRYALSICGDWCHLFFVRKLLWLDGLALLVWQRYFTFPLFERLQDFSSSSILVCKSCCGIDRFITKALKLFLVVSYCMASLQFLFPRSLKDILKKHLIRI